MKSLFDVFGSNSIDLYFGDSFGNKLWKTEFIEDNKDKYTLEVELPGYTTIEIEKREKNMIISGEKKGKKVSDRVYYLSSEIADNVEKISGKYEMGILTIDMTKKRDSPSIKIKIL